MTPMNRRHFLMSTAVMAGGAAVRGLPESRTKPSGSPSSAAADGAGSHVQRVAGAAERRDRRPVRRRRGAHRGEAEDPRVEGPEEAGHLRRLPQAARGQVDRRGLDRHAESLAHAADDLGLPGGQGRLRREAAARTTCSSRSRSSPRRASTTASCSRAVRAGRHPRSGKRVAAARRGRVRRGLHVPRPLLQVARQHRQVPGRPDGPRREVRATPSARRRTSRPTTPRTCRRSNYDLWLGPAPKRAFNRNRFHYNWHWFWDTGNGDLGNQGIHEVDIARWGLGVTHPTKVSAIGGKFMFDDEQETPNTMYGVVRVRRRRQEEDDDVRSAALDLAARSRHQRREARQHDRQSVLRIEGLSRHRQLQQVLLVPGQGSDARARRRPRATRTTPTSSTPCAAASART